MNVWFKIRGAKTTFGQQVYLVGSGPSLGDWNVSDILYASNFDSKYRKRKQFSWKRTRKTIQIGLLKKVFISQALSKHNQSSINILYKRMT